MRFICSCTMYTYCDSVTLSQLNIANIAMTVHHLPNREMINVRFIFHIIKKNKTDTFHIELLIKEDQKYSDVLCDT